MTLVDVTLGDVTLGDEELEDMELGNVTLGDKIKRHGVRALDNWTWACRDPLKLLSTKHAL